MREPTFTSTKFFDIALGLTVLFWSTQSFFKGVPPGQAPWLSHLISGTGIVAGFLLLTRISSGSYPELSKMAGALPSIVLSAIIVARGLASGHWGPAPTLVLVLGVLITTVSFLSLGRKFAIFPRHQDLCQQGAYRWLRHPAYLGELLMVGAAAGTVPDTKSLALLTGCLVATMVRIHLEEQALGADYPDYASAVRYRLLPGIW